MNKALIKKAETLLDELSEMLTSGNHSAETLTALISLKAAAGPALALRKAAVTLDPDSAGALTTTALSELLANWDQRLANVVKNAAPHPIARQRAYDEEFLRMVKELRALQNSAAAIQAAMPIRDASAEMAALKSDGEKSTLDLVKEAHRNNRFGTGVALGFSH
jgi:hypothetical protein